MTVVGVSSLVPLVDLKRFERTHHCTPKCISHVNTRLALQTLPLETIPWGSETTERQRLGWVMGKEGRERIGENRMGKKKRKEKVIESYGSVIV